MQLALAALAMTDTAEATTTLRIYAIELRELHASRLQESAEIGTKLAAAAAYAAGRTDETVLLLKSLKRDGGDNEKFCIGATSSADNQGTPKNLGQCAEADVFSATAVEADLSAEIKTAFTAHSGPGAAIHNTNGNKYHLRKNLNTALADFTGKLTILGGVIEVAATGGFANSNKFKNKPESLQMLKALHDKHGTNVAATKATIQNAPTTLEELKTTLIQYEQNADLRQAERKLRGWPSSKSDDDVNSHLKSLFGIDAATGNHKYTKALDQITLKIKDGETKKNKKVLEMSEKQLAEATYNKMTELTTAAAKKPAAACDTQTTKINATEQACAEAGTDRDKCKELEEKGCIFNDKAKKCELKNDVKAELEKANQEEGKDGIPSSECNDKRQRDCTVNCKCDGEFCKDFTIIVNNNFLLMNAVFLSLVLF
ncbi:Trypanosome variant surface glycoprotein (A-type) [Trypanosoma brucei equiperdum]|uniref:Trypanosome variant surface glycoprotein (A-type) n=1 Tax=Trypanosoma brucei equiperdum TaxID=630700 RepID=A0A3L6L5I3_9TRYP|nr:Trypanosome variant surface glycoprotein (A-type) [Trypanosoma brucei equiperdum]